MLEADVELGGSDQLFNMLVGRNMQKSRGKPGQAVIAMPLLVGLDGVRKMSKSYDNYISFNDSASEMFGKIMSIEDGAMDSYYRLLLAYDDDAMEEVAALHPMEAKKRLASALAAIFYGNDAADSERKRFESIFSERKIPGDVDEIHLGACGDGTVDPVDLLHATGKFASKNEVRRLIDQGAVKLDGSAIDQLRRLGQKDMGAVLQVGRRHFFRLR